MTIKGIAMLLATVSCTAAGQVLMKKGVSGLESLGISAALTSPQIVIGGFCYILGFVIWLNVLQIMPLSIAYPSSSVVYVVVIVLSALFLAEPITAFKLIGMACICTGVVFIGLA
jgi:multidrug transporter EmrE-like cation transporter